MAEERRTPPRTRPPRLGLWRWRRNPLRRRSDVVEAWIVLVGWTVALIGGLLAGQAVAASVDHTLAARRAEAHPVSAVLTQDASADSSLAAVETGDDRVWVKVRWTAADGSAHTGRAKADPGTTAGSAVPVWTDRTGALVAEPASATQARLQAALAGVLATAGAGAGALTCTWLVRGRLVRRRMAEWAEEWERVGPRWRKRMFG
ncbi:hypothetical protein IM697_28065 [Streptomyces ferrugineus]|uniref:Uncharacterized protein n=1 Tax=Streptomyces ferrugineus TaxID=1413221 RepID=A0A7M2SCH7_9ACTN|nr:hypothetical protein [Streptomyces ferrugineus]QOV34016.1 hypothetical protein IM697_28065 [Streptomyces ferrugineus]